MDHFSSYSCEHSPGDGHSVLGILYSYCNMGFHSCYIYMHDHIGFISNIPQLWVSAINAFLRFFFTVYPFIQPNISVLMIFTFAGRYTIWLFQRPIGLQFYLL